jgi:type III pantothenate kinase
MSVFVVEISMTMKSILLVDIGNSSVKWSLLIDGDVKNLSSMSRRYYPENIQADFFLNCWGALSTPVRVVASCVASTKIWYALAQACEQLWSISAEKKISSRESFGLINGYERASDLGSDRWFAMIAAFKEEATESIVVDCGSATTIDVIDASGSHQGGYILPGLAMMKKSLAINTAEVNVDLKLTNTSLSPGRTTYDCVDSAILLSTVKLIEAVYEQQNNNNVRCWLTGGDAELVSELLKIKNVIMPDLVLRGLAYVAIATEK